jgi:hypothetical protein
MISANQLYKQSKSELPFKEWLKETQKKGILQNHEAMYNLIEEGVEPSNSNKTQTAQTAKTKLGMTNLLGFLGLALLVYGLSRTSAE